MADFLAPSVNFIGKGTLAELGPRVAMFGKKALLATDQGVANIPGGPMHKVRAGCDKAGIP